MEATAASSQSLLLLLCELFMVAASNNKLDNRWTTRVEGESSVLSDVDSLPIVERKNAGICQVDASDVDKRETNGLLSSP